MIFSKIRVTKRSHFERLYSRPSLAVDAESTAVSFCLRQYERRDERGSLSRPFATVRDGNGRHYIRLDHVVEGGEFSTSDGTVRKRTPYACFTVTMSPAYGSLGFH